LVDDIERLTDPVLREAGVELVSLQFQREPLGWVLRFFLDKTGGFSLHDCTAWTNRLSDLLDTTELITHAYSLEVSSPGLQRPLRKRDDFERFAGIEAIVKTIEPLNGQKNFHGLLKGMDGDVVLLHDRTNGLVRIPLTAVASAKLDPPVEL
jgi:ribosome maturation factor RimP